MNIDFLSSNRFWALVLVAVVSYLKATGVFDDATSNSLITLLLGFIGIRTVDKVSEGLSNK